MRLAAIILAAGKGTRMKSAGAKVLFEACGRPLICYPVERALELGATSIGVVVGHEGQAVEAIVRAEFPDAPITFPRQTEQLGTGHAVLTAREVAKDADRVLILYGDVPLVRASTLKRLIDAAKKERSPMAIVTAKLADPKGYGRIIRDHAGMAERVVEEKDCAEHERSIREVNVGIYLCEPRLLFGALTAVGRANAQAEYYLTDVVAGARNQGWPVATVESEPEEILGVNDRLDLARISRILRSRTNERWLRAGVTLLDPEVTYIEETVKIGEDTRLGPMVTLDGKTRVGKGCDIGQGSIVIDSELGDGVVVRPYSHLEGARVGKNAIVGPFARLRPGTVLGEGVHVGNFVETKKATLGKGSKANHLSYLGDADVGDGVNIGAGTITCNYDGVAKHRTEIADEAFIGSDTTLVAPVKVGKGAYVGAGSTVTDDVPPGALAVGRARQVNKEGWAARKKKQKG